LRNYSVQILIDQVESVAMHSTKTNGSMCDLLSWITSF